MSQLWGVIYPNGNIAIIYTESADVSPAAEQDCQGALIVALSRELDEINGEVLERTTGEVIFSLEVVQVALILEIKAVASRAIDRIAPIWRQINDLDIPNDPAAQARKLAINGVRNWSNGLEAQLAAATTPVQVSAVRDALDHPEGP